MVLMSWVDGQDKPDYADDSDYADYDAEIKMVLAHQMRVEEKAQQRIASVRQHFDSQAAF